MAKKPETIIKELKKLQPGVEWLPINEVYENPANPRHISESDFEELKDSINNFPQMMVLRPGVIDASGVLQSANQRHKACIALKWTEFPVVRANGLSAEQLKEFMIKDNLSAGTWNTDELFKNWDLDLLKDWTFDMQLLDVRPPVDPPPPEEPKPERLKHQKKINLTYSEEEYLTTKERLSAIAETPELAVKMLLDFWEDNWTVREEDSETEDYLNGKEK
jgi:hypothetical protein